MKDQSKVDQNCQLIFMSKKPVGLKIFDLTHPTQLILIQEFFSIIGLTPDAATYIDSDRESSNDPR